MRAHRARRAFSFLRFGHRQTAPNRARARALRSAGLLFGRNLRGCHDGGPLRRPALRGDGALSAREVGKNRCVCVCVCVCVCDVSGALVVQAQPRNDFDTHAQISNEDARPGTPKHASSRLATCVCVCVIVGGLISPRFKGKKQRTPPLLGSPCYMFLAAQQEANNITCVVAHFITCCNHGFKAFKTSQATCQPDSKAT